MTTYASDLLWQERLYVFKLNANFTLSFQVDGKLRKPLKLSKGVEPFHNMTAAECDIGLMYPSPPKPARSLNHLTLCRRSSTGNIVKQKQAAVKSGDSQRAHSGPAKRTSPSDLKDDERAKSSPVTGRHNNNNNDNYNSSSSISSHSVKDRTNCQPEKPSEQKGPASAETQRLFKIYKEQVQPILKEMDKNLSQKDSKILCDNCQRLSTVLHRTGILPETYAVGSSNFKVQILKSLFSYLGLKDPCLHLRLAKIVLLVCIFSLK